VNRKAVAQELVKVAGLLVNAGDEVVAYRFSDGFQKEATNMYGWLRHHNLTPSWGHEAGSKHVIMLPASEIPALVMMQKRNPAKFGNPQKYPVTASTKVAGDWAHEAKRLEETIGRAVAHNASKVFSVTVPASQGHTNSAECDLFTGEVARAAKEELKHQGWEIDDLTPARLSFGLRRIKGA
jgi:hypothetical protein